MFDKEDPRHFLQFLCGQSYTEMALAPGDLKEFVKEKILRLADHARNAAEVILMLAGMSRQVWVPVQMSIVKTARGGPQGPPTIAAQAPGYQAFVNLGCCQEEMLLVRERNQVTPSEAMKFVEFETYGSLNHKRILYRRPDVESFVYQVSFRIFYP